MLYYGLCLQAFYVFPSKDSISEGVIFVAERDPLLY